MAAERIHGDDTTVPVLAKGKTVTGRLWTYVRDDQPFGGPAPPAAVFHYSRDRRGEHPSTHLAGYAGILQADAYDGFNDLYHPGRKPGPLTEAGCWAHGRRKLLDLAKVARAPLAAEAVRRIDAIFDVERSINGLPAEQRLALRQTHVAPLVAELETWMRGVRGKISRHAEVAKAMDYMLKRWDTFSRFLGDGRICLSTDGVEKPQTSSGCSFLRLFLPRLHYTLVGPLGTFNVVHLLVPDLLDPVVPTWSRFAVLPRRSSFQRQLAELHRGNGIYDLAANAGWVSVGMSHDTAGFAVQTIRRWWTEIGSTRYPEAMRLVITADGGGSNGSRLRLWKRELQRLADELGIDIVVHHLPPGTSKWNKVEHRLFSFITMNWKARPLVSYRVIVDLISATTTDTGLTVRCELDSADYPKGIVVSDREMDGLNISRDAFHGEWNYTMQPNMPSVRALVSG